MCESTDEARPAKRTEHKKRPSPVESSDVLASKETKEINVLRVVTLILLTAIASLSSVGIYWYTANYEQEKFEDSFRTNSRLIIDSFQDSVERKLGAIGIMADAITSHALSSGEKFPRLMLPNYEVLGSAVRIQADAPFIHFMPLVTDETRKDWEEYALENRFQIEKAVERDSKYRREQDKAFNVTLDQNGEPSVLPKRRPNELTVLDDGTGYHPTIWSTGAVRPLGDEPEGNGPYLPMFQMSPAGSPKQGLINLDYAQTAMFAGVLPKLLQTKEAIMHKSAVPVPAMQPLLKQQLLLSHFRHELEPLLNDQHTLMGYPVFDSFEEDRQVAGVLSTSIYWRLFFNKILPPHARGYICVLDNSYNQTMAYRVDGKDVTYLGTVDPHNEHYDYLEQSADINKFVQERSRPSTRSYTTVPLNQEFGKYRLRVYPSIDTEANFKTHKPVFYSSVVLFVIFLTAFVLAVLDRTVAKRQQIVMDRLLQAAEETAAFERDLNSFLAHEVRNPIAAAISAHSFVASTARDLLKKLPDDEAISSLEEDISIIGSSIHFVDEFLRSILDIHRFAANKMEVQLAPTDLLKDVFEPVCSILHQRDGQVIVSVDCPNDVIIMTDCLRLKQVMMNLCRNSIKFTLHGFIRMRAVVVNGLVEISVEDSGPGIPAEKRGRLFEKFQESLDVLSQGTGIGLCLCKSLVELLQGAISLDESYDSGVPGSPGTRFVIKLEDPPLLTESILASSDKSSAMHGFPAEHDALMLPGGMNGISELPENLSVLFVDDDNVLRKLFTRSLRKVAPSWEISEAASGEAALQLIETQMTPDLIFMDQYMASTEKQLLGTDTVRELRNRGITSIICGLSANHMEESFLREGANAFLLKPLPCKKDVMERELVRILSSSEDSNASVTSSGSRSSD